MTDATFAVPPRPSAGLSLNDALIGVALLGFANAEYIRISRQIARDGMFDAVYATFGVSIVVWMALVATVALLRTSEPVRASKLDVAAMTAATLLFLAPATGLSGVGLTLLGGYFSIWGRTDAIRRAMRIALALTVAVLWGRFSFSFFLPYILKADAELVSRLTGLPRHGNLILASDHETVLQIGAGCSSFLNLTNAGLGWAAAMIYYDAPVTRRRLALLLGALLTILAINTLRIGLIGWLPQYYDAIHGEVGANIVNVISSLAIAFFCLSGIRR